MQTVAFFVGATAANVALTGAPFSVGTALSLSGALGSSLGSLVGLMVGGQIVMKDPETNPMVVLGLMVAGGIAVPMIAGANFSTSVAMSFAGTLVQQIVPG